MTVVMVSEEDVADAEASIAGRRGGEWRGTHRETGVTSAQNGATYISGGLLHIHLVHETTDDTARTDGLLKVRLAKLPIINGVFKSKL